MGFHLQVEGIYKSAHASIRANPDAVKKERAPITIKKVARRKLTVDERKNRVAQKKKSFIAKLEQ